MQMTFRWFGEKFDSVKLEHIRQIPGVTGVVSSLMDIPVGETWPKERVEALAAGVKGRGLTLPVIESVNVHEDIKLGLPTRDKYINNYKDTIARLAAVGVKVICYNFMPVLDWARSELYHALPDGSNTMLYDPNLVNGITPSELARRYAEQCRDYELPGWEPERLKQIDKYLEMYKHTAADDVWGNLKYFLDAITPVCEEVGVVMAIHPDDPPYDVFGLPRLIINRENIVRLFALNDSPANGLTLCAGSLGASIDNDVPAIAREFAATGRVYFAHIRNLKHVGGGVFYESAHLSREGSLDLFAILKALRDGGFDGYIRPDHGRMIWGEEGRPGYGLYDRALGAAYINGIWEALTKNV